MDLIIPSDQELSVLPLDELQMRRVYIHQAMIVYEQSFIGGALGDPATSQALQVKAYNRYADLRKMLVQIDVEIMTRFTSGVGNMFN